MPGLSAVKLVPWPWMIFCSNVCADPGSVVIVAVNVSSLLNTWSVPVFLSTMYGACGWKLLDGGTISRVAAHVVSFVSVSTPFVCLVQRFSPEHVLSVVPPWHLAPSHVPWMHSSEEQ